MLRGCIYFYGYGVYEGDFEIPCAELGMRQREFDVWIDGLKAEDIVPENYVLKNPRITLDDGRLVWGAQCWWAPEDEVRQILEASDDVINV